jgi:hypothetical protein
MAGLCMGFPKKEILIACVNTSFVLKILKTTRNKQRFPNKEMLVGYMTKLLFLEIDSIRFEIDSIRFEIDSIRLEIDSIRLEIDSIRLEIDSISSCSPVFINVQVTS